MTEPVSLYVLAATADDVPRQLAELLHAWRTPHSPTEPVRVNARMYQYSGGGSKEVTKDVWSLPVVEAGKSPGETLARLADMAPSWRNNWGLLAGPGSTHPRSLAVFRVELSLPAEATEAAPAEQQLHVDFYRCSKAQLLEAVDGAQPGLHCARQPRVVGDAVVGVWAASGEDGAAMVAVELVYAARGEQPTWWVGHPRQPPFGAVQVRTVAELADELATCLAAQQKNTK